MTGQWSIVIPEFLYRQLRTILLEDQHRETAVFLLAGIHHGSQGTRILCRKILTIPPLDYRDRTSVHLDISPRAVNGLASLCEASGLTAVFCHSHVHTGGEIQYSPSDDFGEMRMARTLASFNGAQPIGSLLISESRMKGRVWSSQSKKSAPAAKVTVIGDTRSSSVNSDDSPNPQIFPTARFDRQVLAFGTLGQAQLSKASIGIIGLGGTGSSVAEQLARLGIGRLVLVDDDYLEDSNISRVYGSYPDAFPPRRIWPFSKRSRKKVKIIADNIRKIAPTTDIESIFGNVVATRASSRLLDCDMLMLCTDEHWGRAIVNEISYQYLIPTINIGVRIDAPDGRITGATGSLHILGPGKPCLWCYQYLSGNRISAESMLPEQRAARLREGYAESVGRSPMVISLTTTMAGLAVTQLLHYFTGFRRDSGTINCLRYDILEGTVSRGGVQQRSEPCVCNKLLSLGEVRPLSTLDDEDFIRKCRAKSS